MQYSRKEESADCKRNPTGLFRVPEERLFRNKSCQEKKKPPKYFLAINVSGSGLSFNADI